MPPFKFVQRLHTSLDHDSVRKLPQGMLLECMQEDPLLEDYVPGGKLYFLDAHKVVAAIRIHDLHLEPAPQKPAPKAPLVEYCFKDPVSSVLWRKAHLTYYVRYEPESFTSLALLISGLA